MDELITIECDDAAVRAYLAELLRRGRDLTPAMQSAASLLAAAVRDNFAAQGRPPWPNLAPATIKAREVKGHWPGKILQQRGHLARSVQQGHCATEAWVGSNLRYAAVHQLGGTIQIPARTVEVLLKRYSRGPRKGRSRFAKPGATGPGLTRKTVHIPAYSVHIPARPFLGLTEEDTAKLREAIVRHLGQS